ncbi:MAG TPA: gluconokinase, GntK/IdnK-type [Opitutaceae bacterium]|nr:gluconokinase, GntK/IdnK-type [Opitutaceae bacterium]
MARVTGLRSPHAKVGRVVVFGRMLDKIRLQDRGALPPEYQANVGEAKPQAFDARCCRFLGVGYAGLRARTLQGGCDEEILSWAHSGGAPRGDEDCLAWNRYITTVGWRDERSAHLRESAAKFGVADQRPETICELIDLDEGRPAGATRSWEAHPLSVVIVMGVAGCGKTTVGLGLARALGWEFLETDGLHPASNLAKMSAGIPLDDSDRAPWLGAIAAELASRIERGAKTVVACSALRGAFRSALTPDPGPGRYVHLRGDFELIKGRLGGRSGHFMKESMLQSQFDALEAPTDALTLDASQAPQALVSRIRHVFGV